MNEEIAEYYEELYNLCAVEQEQPLARRYRQLREALERVMRQQMMGTVLSQHARMRRRSLTQQIRRCNRFQSVSDFTVS